MTALLRHSAAPGTAWAIGAPRLLAGLDRHERLDLASHLATHGPVPAIDRDRLLVLLDTVGLAGRGGAGFPVAAKLRALHGAAREVVVNGNESEPGSGKDRLLLDRSPHLVLDGAVTLAAACGAGQVTVAVHDAALGTAVRAAIRERRDRARLRVVQTPRGFVAGEARAVVRTLGGGPAIPPGRRTPPTEHGVLVFNVETVAALAVLVRLGSHRYAETGTRAEPGTTLLTVGGAVQRPGVVEIPIGTPLQIVLAAAGAATPSTTASTVVVGGYHGGWHSADAPLLMARASMAAAGGTLGAGVLLVLDTGTCALGELAVVTAWLAGESTKQCGPCRFGLPALAADVDAVYRGHGAAAAVAQRHAAAVTGRGACAHPDGTARFVRSGLALLADEIAQHVHHGGCGRPVQHRLPTTGDLR